MREFFGNEVGQPSNKELAFYITRRATYDVSSKLPNTMDISEISSYVLLVEQLLDNPVEGAKIFEQMEFLSTRIMFGASIGNDERKSPEANDLIDCFTTAYVGCFDQSDFEYDANKLIQEKENAIKLASKKGMPVESIYRDDDLYVELMSVTSTPEEYALRKLEIIEKILNRFPEKMVDVVAETQSKRYEEKYGKNKFDEAARVFTEASGPTRESKVQEMKGVAVGMSKSAASSLREYLTKYWGENAFSTLPQDIQDRLMTLTE